MKKFLALLLIVLAVQCTKWNKKNHQESVPFEQITDFVQATLDVFNIPGLAISITKDDEIVYLEAFGVRNIETQEQLEPEHFFHFASVSKPFVATAIMQLVEQKKISLDDRLTTHLPYFKISDDRYKSITIRQLLNHTSGLGDVRDYEWESPRYEVGAAEDYVKSLTKERLQFTPGTDWAYSNLAFDIMGDVIAKVSGMPFETFIKRNIFTPLDMEHSSFIYPEISKKLRTKPHVWKGVTIISDIYPYNRIHAPSSTLNSSVFEMSHWAIANLNKGRYKNSRILSEDSYELLWANSVTLQNRPKIGLGWFLGEYKGSKLVAHSGSDLGYSSNFVMLADSNISVVIASNYTHTPVDKIAKGILEILLGHQPKVPKQHIGVPFIEIYKKEGIEAAIDFFEKAKEDTLKSRHYIFDEKGLTEIGHYADRLGLMDEAVVLFEFNAELNPNSVDAHNQLGQILLKTNKMERAKDSFKKTLEIDPKNDFAIKKINALNDTKDK